MLPAAKLESVPLKMFASDVNPVQFGNVVAPGMVPLSIESVTYCPNALTGVVVYSRTVDGSDPA